MDSDAVAVDTDLADRNNILYRGTSISMCSPMSFPPSLLGWGMVGRDSGW